MESATVKKKKEARLLGLCPVAEIDSVHIKVITMARWNGSIEVLIENLKFIYKTKFRFTHRLTFTLQKPKDKPCPRRQGHAFGLEGHSLGCIYNLLVLLQQQAKETRILVMWARQIRIITARKCPLQNVHRHPHQLKCQTQATST